MIQGSPRPTVAAIEWNLLQSEMFKRIGRHFEILCHNEAGGPDGSVI